MDKEADRQEREEATARGEAITDLRFVEGIHVLQRIPGRIDEKYKPYYTQEELEMKELMHRTMDGRSVPVPGMSDRHLVNAIAYIARRLVEATDRISNLEKPRSARATALYGDRSVELENYKALTVNFFMRAGPYVIEAVTRGINIRPILVAALGRDSQDPEAPTIPTPRAPLPEGRMADLVAEVNPGWDRIGAGA